MNDPATNEPSRPVIFKMHGSIDKSNTGNDSYLITEEDYIDFLGRPGGSYVPPYLSGLMQGKDFLLLGYSLEGWNVRVILRKLMKAAKSGEVRFWAIVRVTALHSGGASPRGSEMCTEPRWQLSHVGLLGAASILALGIALAAPPAAAQFVCGGSATGDERQTGGGAVVGSGGNIACGSFADASGDNSFNSAAGNSSNASGDNSRNTATGTLANANGANSNNVATGDSSNARGNRSSNTATALSLPPAAPPAATPPAVATPTPAAPIASTLPPGLRPTPAAPTVATAPAGCLRCQRHPQQQYRQWRFGQC